MLTLRPYQFEAVVTVEREGTLILADDCGLGKTLVGIATAHACNSWPVLVVCNSSARRQWETMIHDQYPDDAVMLSNKVPWDYEKMRSQSLLQWVIASWDELTMKSAASFFQVVWPLVIADEVHKAKNRIAKRTQALKKILAIRKLGLSATPYEHSDEVWSLLNWLDPYQFPGYWAWVQRYFNMVDNYYSMQKQAGELKDPEAFQRLLAPWVLRRTKEQVLPDLPPKIEIPTFVGMTPQQKAMYNTLAQSKDVVVQLGDQDQDIVILNALALLTKLQQVSTSPKLIIPDSLEQGTKLRWVDDHVNDNPHRKVVFFTRFIQTAKWIAESLGCECLAQGQGDPTFFQKGLHKYVVGTIDSMGESLDFPMADDAVFVETHWSSIKMQQAIDRVHRSNIVSPKNIYFLLSSRTDKRILKAAQDKIDERRMALEFARARPEEMVESES
jgi:SNF2 family DNA or RNA helicase